MLTLAEVRAKLPAYPIELTFPDISRWRDGNCGIEYIHTFDSGIPGPHVMVLALVHGNEVCGAIVVDTLLGVGLRPIRGRLSFGFANTAAYLRFDESDPDAARFIDEDMNRLWSDIALNGGRRSSELRRAREIRPFLDTVDMLIDIHSMHEESPALMMCGSLEKGAVLAAEIGYPEHVVIDAGHASGKRLRDYGGFGDPDSGKNALLIEAGQHFSRKARDVALDVSCRFLVHANVVDMCSVQDFLTEKKPVRQRFIQITHPVIARTMDFSFTNYVGGLEEIPVAGTAIAYDGGKEIVTPYDNCVIVQPSLRHLSPGVTVMRLGQIVDR